MVEPERKGAFIVYPLPSPTPTSSTVPLVREDMLLVHGAIQHAVRAIKTVLRPVPVMDVPVNDRNPVNAFSMLFSLQPQRY